MNEKVKKDLQDVENNEKVKKDLHHVENNAILEINEEPVSGRSTQQALKERNKKMKRVPLKDQVSLSFDLNPNYKYREVIDRGGRLKAFQQAGYIFDEKPTKEHEGRSKDATNIGKYRTRIVGTMDNGQPIRAFIMKIKKEWYDADQEAKLDVIDQRMRQVAKIEGIEPKYMKEGGKVEISRS
jgi:hypothetical protein